MSPLVAARASCSAHRRRTGYTRSMRQASDAAPLTRSRLPPAPTRPRVRRARPLQDQGLLVPRPLEIAAGRGEGLNPLPLPAHRRDGDVHPRLTASTASVAVIVGLHEPPAIASPATTSVNGLGLESHSSPMGAASIALHVDGRMGTAERATVEPECVVTVRPGATGMASHLPGGSTSDP